MTTKDILHENGAFWVVRRNGLFYVMQTGVTHSTSDSAYADESLAVARCDYLAKRAKK